MERRRFLGLCALVGFAAAAGCSTGDGTGDDTPPDDAQVTTTGGAEIEFTLAQVVVRDDLDGPAVNYRLRNDGDEDATVKVRTVLSIEGGNAYEQAAYLSVPAGDEVTVMYVVVDEERLTDDERRRIGQGDVSFETYLNGERRMV